MPVQRTEASPSIQLLDSKGHIGQPARCDSPTDEPHGPEGPCWSHQRLHADRRRADPTRHRRPGIEIPVMTAGQVATVVFRIPLAAWVMPARRPQRACGKEARRPLLTRPRGRFRTGRSTPSPTPRPARGYAIGGDAETTLVQGLRERWGLPVGSSSLAAVQALRAYGIDRVDLVRPPWFDDATSGWEPPTFGPKASMPSPHGRTPCPMTRSGAARTRRRLGMSTRP